MSETINEMYADISETFGVDDDKLSTLAELAAQEVREQEAIEQLEQQLKEAKGRLHKMKTEIIPDYMDELGIESFTLTNGATIKVEPFYQCSIPKARRDEAFQWLTEHGYDDLIKVNVTVTFGKSQYREACELAENITDQGYPVAPQLSVHPMTLKGWIRSMSEEGEEFPLDLFGAFIGRTTKIK